MIRLQVVYRDDAGEVILGSLNDHLEAVLGMFLECRDVHGMSEEQAKWAALDEVIEGTKAHGESKLHPAVAS